MSGNSYTTAGRTKILEYLRINSDRAVNAHDIHAWLCEQRHEVNMTTIYRYLDKLTAAGDVMKYADETASQAVYQYVAPDRHCEEHLHLQCIGCGCITHLDCSFMQEISDHIETEHGFRIQCRNSIIYGLCEKCRRLQKISAGQQSL